MNTANMTYQATGVNYDQMDPFKRKAQMAARQTAVNILPDTTKGQFNRGRFIEVEASRGESAYLIETITNYLAHVEEGLGTKNLVADAMYKLTGKSYYDHLAQDTVAMILNDMITLGARPLSVAMHLAVGTSDWFNDEVRTDDLITGWKMACDIAGCTWGCGETPTLKGVVVPEAVVLSGSAIGVIEPKERIIVADDIQDGDAIIFIESSGIHANGLTMARKIADNLPDGYLTQLSDGKTFGDTLLIPTYIYVQAVEQCLNAGVNIHYAVNITGHGWRKLMRATKPFTYVIEQLPTQLPIFDFIQKHGPVDDQEAYGNFNMGAGFALYVPEEDVNKTVQTINSQGLRAFRAGYISADEKKVIIKPKNLEYTGDTLAVR